MSTTTDARPEPGSEPAPGSDPDTTTGGGADHAVVLLEGVSRRFGDVQALDDLSIRVPEATITVLVGPNGAGKTTAIRTITGALDCDEGHVRTFGLDPMLDGERVRSRCGIVSAKPALYDRLSGWDNLAYAAELYRLGRGTEAEARIREAATRFGIQHALDKQVGGYSTGMKTRLALARSIMHRPDLVLFDEPTSGLDPESSHAVLEMIREMAADGTTVVMCTHLLLEAEGLADQVVVLEDGSDLLSGTMDELTSRYWPGFVVRLDAEQRSDLDALEGREGVLSYERNGHVTIELDDLGRVPDLIGSLTHDGVRLTRVEPHVPTLEDLYFEVRKGKGPFSEQSAGGQA